jgi:hypothetical protein
MRFGLVRTLVFRLDTVHRVLARRSAICFDPGTICVRVMHGVMTDVSQITPPYHYSIPHLHICMHLIPVRPPPR